MRGYLDTGYVIYIICRHREQLFNKITRNGSCCPAATINHINLECTPTMTVSLYTCNILFIYGIFYRIQKYVCRIKVIPRH